MSFSVMISSGYIHSSRIAVSYGSFIPSFLQNLHTVIHSGCIGLCSHQECKRIPLSSHPLAFTVCELLDDGHSDPC